MTTIVARNRWHWWIPRSWHPTLRGIAHVLGLLAATAALTGLGYWLLTHGHEAPSFFFVLSLDAPAYVALFWLLARDRSNRELIEKAVDDFDRVIGAQYHDEPSTGRHAKREAA